MARTSGKLDTEATLIRVGEAVRQLRAARGMSQEALADAARVDRSHMGKIERGERNVTILLLSRIAGALGTSIATLLTAAGV